eukprot:TRINITY_DN15158_c0_g1_i3.p1 TRINITY_DN15158_c0_g1~~TRINITY_DN15158_c0_g1_i3.p1  ORF type:complete len:418 (+),score=88.31 TRINITY_DN15158_c0_g1_i3:142-1395(+)
MLRSLVGSEMCIRDRHTMEPRIKRDHGTVALTLAPTRELVVQIELVWSKVLDPFPWCVVGSVMGGEKRKSEKARLRKGITVMVATPGRLLDHLKTSQAFCIGRLQFLVLDEADRLLDQGFMEDISAILRIIFERTRHDQPRRQSVLVSATLSEGVSKLAGLSLQDPVTVTGSTATSQGAAPDSEGLAQYVMPKQIKQEYYVIGAKQRLIVLIAALRQRVAVRAKTVVFMLSCASVDFHEWVLANARMSHGSQEAEKIVSTPVFKLHGNMTQSERTQVYLRFCRAKTGILICTSVAARGLDLPGVSHIIQYDPPEDASEFVHQVGRAGRLGQSGSALLFLLPTEQGYAAVLNRHKLELQEGHVTEKLLDHLKQGKDDTAEKAAATYNSISASRWNWTHPPRSWPVSYTHLTLPTKRIV